jgi:hypothetical protein
LASKTRANIPAANGADAKKRNLKKKRIFNKSTNQKFLYDHQYMNYEDQLLSIKQKKMEKNFLFMIYELTTF